MLNINEKLPALFSSQFIKKLLSPKLLGKLSCPLNGEVGIKTDTNLVVVISLSLFNRAYAGITNGMEYILYESFSIYL